MSQLGGQFQNLNIYTRSEVTRISRLARGLLLCGGPDGGPAVDGPPEFRRAVEKVLHEIVMVGVIDEGFKGNDFRRGWLLDSIGKYLVSEKKCKRSPFGEGKDGKTVHHWQFLDDPGIYSDEATAAAVRIVFENATDCYHEGHRVAFGCDLVFCPRRESEAVVQRSFLPEIRWGRITKPRLVRGVLQETELAIPNPDKMLRVIHQDITHESAKRLLSLVSGDDYDSPGKNYQYLRWQMRDENKRPLLQEQFRAARIQYSRLICEKTEPGFLREFELQGWALTGGVESIVGDIAAVTKLRRGAARLFSWFKMGVQPRVVSDPEEIMRDVGDVRIPGGGYGRGFRLTIAESLPERTA